MVHGGGEQERCTYLALVPDHPISWRHIFFGLRDGKAVDLSYMSASFLVIHDIFA